VSFVDKVNEIQQAMLFNLRKTRLLATHRKKAFGWMSVYDGQCSLEFLAAIAVVRV